MRDNDRVRRDLDRHLRRLLIGMSKIDDDTEPVAFLESQSSR